MRLQTFTLWWRRASAQLLLAACARSPPPAARPTHLAPVASAATRPFRHPGRAAFFGFLACTDRALLLLRQVGEVVVLLAALIAPPDRSPSQSPSRLFPWPPAASSSAGRVGKASSLQNYNNELVKCAPHPRAECSLGSGVARQRCRARLGAHRAACAPPPPRAAAQGIEDLREKREEVNRSIAKDEEEKAEDPERPADPHRAAGAPQRQPGAQDRVAQRVRQDDPGDGGGVRQDYGEQPDAAARAQARERQPHEEEAGVQLIGRRRTLKSSPLSRAGPPHRARERAPLAAPEEASCSSSRRRGSIVLPGTSA